MSVNKEKSTLVYFSDKDFMKTDIICNTKIITEEFNKEHKTVLRDVKNLIEKVESIENSELRGQYKFVPSYYVSKQGKKLPMYELNFEAFMLVTMSYTTQKAMEIKSIFIYEFNRMRAELSAIRIARREGIDIRNDMTDAIQEHLDTAKNKYLYANYTDMVYKVLFGKTTTHMKVELGLIKRDNLRNHLQKEQLEQLKKVEKEVAVFIEFGYSFKEIRKMLEKKYN
ncbi:Rha family transcriptional regulator [Clostridium felsineum]|uniref:Rha family transcriptional regulator n=1 Tax=Clostridium felsineum TaxID=36839 RepID=UPI00098C34E2|nr:Rha family transcriptional regulator [Clostridium felsineum]URZ16920.1 hypothetical protein CLFE_029670 [Clostridium felsineum DSM 794]